MQTVLKRLALVLTVALLCAAPFAARAATAYVITNSVVLGGDGGWDYLIYDRDNQARAACTASRWPPRSTRASRATAATAA
jgi:predicted lipoprotein with Yx(FWY)xxD motif